MSCNSSPSKWTSPTLKTLSKHSTSSAVRFPLHVATTHSPISGCPLERELSGPAALSVLALCRRFHDRNDVLRQQHMAVMLESVLLSGLPLREIEANVQAFAVGPDVVREYVVPIYESVIFQHAGVRMKSEVEWY